MKEKKRPQGLDYWLGTKDGQSRLLIIITALSITVAGLGYALIFWIMLNGGI